MSVIRSLRQVISTQPSIQTIWHWTHFLRLWLYLLALVYLSSDCSFDNVFQAKQSTLRNRGRYISPLVVVHGSGRLSQHECFSECMIVCCPIPATDLELVKLSHSSTYFSLLRHQILDSSRSLPLEGIEDHVELTSNRPNQGCSMQLILSR